MLDELTRQLTDRTPLTAAQVRQATEGLVQESIGVEAKAAFLSALAGKGETVDEIAEFARLLREMALRPPIDLGTRARGILDVVGTGGDGLGTINLSTAAAILAAAGGVLVAKHGNRAVTSRAGSADVLEALGVPIDLSPEAATASLREQGFAFFFAPRYHPAFKHIGPARRLCAERGQRTIFNYLGPLLNPAAPTAQLMGVLRPDLCEPLARVLQSLSVRRGMVVCGATGNARDDGAASQAPTQAWMDEFSTLGPTTIAEFYQDRGVHLTEFSPAALALQTASLVDLRGGTAHENAAILRRILSGEERGPKRDAVLLNAGAALFVAGQVRTLTDGWDRAATLIDTGAASAKLEELVTGQ